MTEMAQKWLTVLVCCAILVLATACQHYDPNAFQTLAQSEGAAWTAGGAAPPVEERCEGLQRGAALLTDGPQWVGVFTGKALAETAEDFQEARLDCDAATALSGDATKYRAATAEMWAAAQRQVRAIEGE